MCTNLPSIVNPDRRGDELCLDKDTGVTNFREPGVRGVLEDFDDADKAVATPSLGNKVGIRLLSLSGDARPPTAAKEISPLLDFIIHHIIIWSVLESLSVTF